MSRMSDYCDIACDECSQWEPGTQTLTKWQRKVLKKKGWSVRVRLGTKEDICPACNGTNPHYWGYR